MKINRKILLAGLVAAVAVAIYFATRKKECVSSEITYEGV